MPFPGSSINPVTGRVEEKPPNPMAGMTDEQKEHEAMRLVNMLDKLSRCVLSLEERPGHSRGGGQCWVHFTDGS